jgi:hypothetical protein
MDFKLDRLTWDLDMASGRVEVVTGNEAVIQSIRVRYQTFLGEWFLDGRVGVPWFQELLGNKSLTDDRLNFVLRRVLATTPGVAQILSFHVTKASAQNRTVELDWSARLDSGRILKSSDFGPFIIDLSTILG